MYNRLDLSDEQFLVFNRLLARIRLGNNGTFTRAISDLLRVMNSQGLETCLDDIARELGEDVSLSFDFNDDDGMTIYLN